MPLEPQTKELPLTIGVDHSDDPQGSPQGLMVAEDLVWNKDRAPERRGGIRPHLVDVAHTNRAFLPAGDSLGVIQADRVVPLVGSYALDIGLYGQVGIQSEVVATAFAGTKVAQVSMARRTVAGRAYICLGVVCYSEAEGIDETSAANLEMRLYSQVIDETTGVVVASHDHGVDRYAVRVLSVRTDDFAVVYINHTSKLLAVARWGFDSVAGWTCTVTGDVGTNIRSDFQFRPTFDAMASTASVNVIRAAWADDSTDQLVIGTITFDGSGVPTMSTTSSPALTPVGELSIARHPSAGSTAVLVGLFNNGTSQAVIYYTTGGVTTPITGMSTSALAGLTWVSGNTYVFVESALADNSTQVWYYDLVTHVVVGPTNWPSALPIVKPFVVDGRVYLAGLPGESNRLTHTILVARAPSGTEVVPATVGQVGFDEAVPYVGVGDIQGLPGVVVGDAATDVYIAVPVDLETGAAAADGVPVRRVRVVRLDFSTSLPIAVTQLNDVGFAGGGAVTAFDGTKLYGAGFLAEPPVPDLTLTTGTLTGSYSYLTLYEWSDLRGNIVVSQPSLPATIAATADGITVDCLIAPHMIGALDPNSDQRPLRLKVYRTVAGGSVFYLAYTTVLIPSDYSTVISYTDSMSDVDLTTAETLYTTGGVVSAESAPPVTHLISHRNRLFGVRVDQPEIVPYTTEAATPVMPLWNAVLTMRLDHEGGPVTALGSLGDKLVLFQRDSAAIVTGLGPNATGPDASGNSGFSLPEVVVRGVGVAANDFQSVVSVPQGVMFRHSSGIQLLTPDLQVSPIGRAVEDYVTGETIHRARYLPSLHQVWVLTDERILVWDTRYSRWSVFPVSHLTTFVDVVEHRGVVYLLSANAVWIYHPTHHVDLNQGGSSHTPTGMKFEIPWQRIDRAQSLRVWRTYLSGTADRISDCVIRILVYTQQARWRTKDATVADHTFLWDSAALDFFPDGPATLFARIVTQRCQAFRVRVEIEGNADETNDEGETYAERLHFRPATVSFDFGIEPSRGKAPVAARAQP